MATEQAGAGIPVEIGPQEFEAMRREGKPHLGVDVREAWELDVCKISDTLHLPLGELPVRIGELPKDKPVVVICRSGRRSMDATMFLRERGYANATNLRGGVLLWGREIDPTMEAY